MERLLAEHFLYGILIFLLIAATITDLKHRLIYDRFVVIGVIAAVGFRLFVRTEPWWNYLLTGLGAFFILYVIAALTDERSIGGGDVKLFGMLGLALGFRPFLLIFFLSHFLAIIYLAGAKMIRWNQVGWKTEFPFAPFILVATVIAYLWNFDLL